MEFVVINALYKAVSVSLEIPVCSSGGSLVNRVNLLESYYSLPVILLDGERLVVDFDKLVHA